MKFASLYRFVAAAVLLVAVVGCTETTDPIDTTTPIIDDTTTPPADAPLGTDPTVTDTVPAEPVVVED